MDADEPLGHLLERHHAAKSEGEDEESEEESGHVVPAVERLAVGAAEATALAVLPHDHTHADDEAEEAHQRADAGEDDDHVAPKTGVVPQVEEIDPVRDGADPSPKAIRAGAVLHALAGAGGDV